MEYIVKTINELCCRITDGSHYSPVEQEEGYPMYSSKDMLYDDFDDSSVKRIAKDDYDKLVKQDCKPLKDDIVIIKDGNSYLKRVFRIKKDIDAVILSSIAILRPQKMIIDPRYFAYVLRTNSVHSAMANYVSGAAIPRIVLRDFKKMKVSIHKSLEAQQKIASILSTYDTLIENNTKRIRLLEQMAENLYKEWFVRFRFPGHENVEMENGLPKGWKVERLNAIASYSTTRVRSESVSMYVTTENMLTNYGGVDMVKDVEIPAGYVTSVRKNDILVSNIRPYFKKIWLSNMECGCSSDVLNIRAKNPIYSDYLYQSLRTDTFFDHVMSGANGTKMPRGNKNFTMRFPVIVPTEGILIRYSNIVSEIGKLRNSLNAENTLLTRQRDLLLPRLMSGKLEVKG